MGLLIDANVLIAAERGLFSLSDLGSQWPEEPCAVAAITASELLHGIYRASDAARRAKRQRFVDEILDRFRVLPFDLPAARTHAAIWATLQSQGQIIGAHDLIVAATAQANDYAVGTANESEFRRVAGLRVLNPLR
jgi:predicted nucleic acid-binding protein